MIVDVDISSKSSNDPRTAASHFDARTGNLSLSPLPEDPPPPYTEINLEDGAMDHEPVEMAKFSYLQADQFCRFCSGMPGLNTWSTNDPEINQPGMSPGSPGLQEIQDGGRQLVDSSMLLVETSLTAVGGVIQGFGKILTGFGRAVAHRRAVFNDKF